MANHSKLTLYVASVQVGEVRTLVKPQIYLSSEQVRRVLLEHDATLLEMLDQEKPLEKFVGNVRLAASLEVAFDYLLYSVAPVVGVFSRTGKKISIEVMFNDPTINRVVREGRVDQWRKNNFAFKNIGASRQPIQHASKWAAFDELLRRLGGKVCCNHDDILRAMVANLKKLSRRKIDKPGPKPKEE